MATLTVGDLTPRDQYTATSGQTVFTYSFPIFSDSDLKVYVGPILKTLSTDYTVTTAGTSSGGTVVFGSALTTGDVVTIYRDLPVARTTDYATGGALLAENLNDDLDKLVMMVQQLESDLNTRTLRFGQWTTGLPLSEFIESDTDRAGKVLGFDINGNPNITQELGVFRDDWATSTAYGARDLIKDPVNDNVYFCVTAHTSSGSAPLSSNADVGKWAMIVDSESAGLSAAAAATSETNAETAETNAETAKTGAETAKTAAETAKTAAETAKAGAETAKTNAETAQTAAETAQTAAEAAYDSFDARYLGTKASDPTTDNDGGSLVDGALYWNTTDNVLMAYDLGNTTWSFTTPTPTEQTAINTVNANITTINTVAGKDTEIGRLGTTDAVADMATLGTADIVSDMNTLATTAIVADMDALANKTAELGRLGTTDAIADMNTLGSATIVSDMNTVAGKATEIGRLGTAAAVADMVILATDDVVDDMNTLGTSAIVNNMSTVAGIASNVTSVAGKSTQIGLLGTTAVINDMGILGTNDVVNDMDVLASNATVTSMNNLGTPANVTNMATVATNLTDINSFASAYRIASSDPTTSLNGGDLYFNTSTNRMRVYDGSAWIDVAISSGDFVTKTGSTASAQMPVGTEAQRDSTPAAGMFRYNSDTSDFEGYTTEWGAIAGTGAGGDNDFDGGDSATLYGSADIDIESGASV